MEVSVNKNNTIPSNRKKKAFSLLLHVMFWFLIFIIFNIAITSMYYPILQLEGNPFQIWWSIMSTLLVCILSFYSTFFIMKKGQNVDDILNRYVKVILLILILSALYFYALVTLYYEHYRGGEILTYFSSFKNHLQAPPFLALLPATLFSIIGIVFQKYHHSITLQEKEYILKNEKLELQLVLVKSQLNPHFLFNTLNNIEHLIRKAPNKASESIIQLSSLLRYQVYEAPEIKVKIERDIHMIENYLTLQMARLNKPELVTFKKEVKNINALITPALFLPFIENAFKHANLNELGAYIEIDLKESDNTINFNIKNSKSELRTQGNSKHQGAGLSLINKRLELLYPNRHQINIENSKNYFSVSLQINLI